MQSQAAKYKNATPQSKPRKSNPNVVINKARANVVIYKARANVVIYKARANAVIYQARVLIDNTTVSYFTKAILCNTGQRLSKEERKIFPRWLEF